MASRLLVTGLSGFVGSHVAALVPGAADLLLDGRLADLRDAADVRAAVAQAAPVAVLHLAAQSFVPLSVENPGLTHQVNVGGTRNLLEALHANGFRGRMLYVASADAYGAVPEHELPVSEARPLNPLNPYAQSKAEAEALCVEWSRRGHFEIVIAVASFARQIAACRAGRGPRVLVAGDLDVTRDFTDVRDVVRAYAALLESGRNGQAYNVCSGVERSLRAVADAMMEAAGVAMKIETEPSLLRKSEQRRMWGSFAKLEADTGWQPAIDFRQTVLDTLDYWDKEGTP